MTIRRKARGLAAPFAGLLVTSLAFAQTSGPPVEAVYPTDLYGNVQPVEERWRPIGSFANEVERDAYQGYQTGTRRFGQRSGLSPFALPSDLWAASRLAATGAASAPSIRSRLTPGKRSAFERYGGFGRRKQNGETTDIFTRKHGLIAAGALNAPVYRAMAGDRTLIDLQGSVVRTPFLSPDVGATDEPSPTLETRLEVSDQQTHARVREEAWALFREGQYRAAIRTFETAISLQPADFEMRIGEIFSYLSVSGRRTAVALLEELVRRDENPFQHAIRMRERYGNVGDTQALQLQARQAIDDPNQNLEVTVLYVLVLWHLGLEDEALRAAESIARRALGKPYALWPEKMRAARRPAPSTP